MLASSIGLDVLDEVVMSEVVVVGRGERERNVLDDEVVVDGVGMNDDEAVVGEVVVVDRVRVDDDGVVDDGGWTIW